MIPSSWVSVLSASSVSRSAVAGDQRIEVEQRELVDPARDELVENLLREDLVRLEDHLARALVDDVDRRHAFHSVASHQVFDRIDNHSIPASRILRTPALVNLRSLRTSTVPSAVFTSRRQRCPTSRSGTMLFSYFLPSVRMISGL